MRSDTEIVPTTPEDSPDGSDEPSDDVKLDDTVDTVDTVVPELGGTAETAETAA